MCFTNCQGMTRYRCGQWVRWPGRNRKCFTW